MTLGVTALITDAFAATVRSQAASQRQDLVHAGAVRVIYWNSPNFFSQCQPVFVHVNHHHLTRAFDYCRVSRHQSYRTGTINDD